MVGEAAARDPLVPEVPGSGQPLVGLGERLRRRAIARGERAENLLAGLQPLPGRRARTLEPQVQVGRQPDLRLPVGGATSARPYDSPALRQTPRSRP
jgi:hypothetical protein